MPITLPKSAAMPQFGATAERKRYDESIRFDQEIFPTKVDVDVFDDIVLLGGARTPFGAAGGSLKDVSALDLLKIAMRGALEKSGLSPEDAKTHVSQVIAGNIIANHEGAGFIAKNVALALGLPQSITALQVNRLCGTGFEALRQAAKELANGGEENVILTGGVENMSRTPVMDPERMLAEGKRDYLRSKGLPLPPQLAGADKLTKGKLSKKLGAVMAKRDAKKNGPAPYENPLQKGLTDPMADLMIGTADKLAKLEGVSKDEADAFGARSQMRAAAAQTLGLFDDEIVPVKKEDLTKEGLWKSHLSSKTPVVTRDEHVRFKTPAKAEQLDQAYEDFLANMKKKLKVQRQNAEDAIHTAGTSSGVVDGAAAIAVSSGKFAADKNLQVLAKLKAVAVSGCPAGLMGAGPIPAIRGVLKAAGLTVNDVDLFEVNEAFAGQALTVARQVGIPMEKFNVDGGALALGHPLSASGSRITLHAANRLKQDNKRFAVVSACIGGGQGIAALIENPNAKPNAIETQDNPKARLEQFQQERGLEAQG